jgi:hypothetical protein
MFDYLKLNIEHLKSFFGGGCSLPNAVCSDLSKWAACDDQAAVLMPISQQAAVG